jgi:hypothetical protein
MQKLSQPLLINYKRRITYGFVDGIYIDTCTIEGSLTFPYMVTMDFVLYIV